MSPHPTITVNIAQLLAQRTQPDQVLLSFHIFPMSSISTHQVGSVFALYGYPDASLYIDSTQPILQKIIDDADSIMYVIVKVQAAVARAFIVNTITAYAVSWRIGNYGQILFTKDGYSRFAVLIATPVRRRS